MSVRHLIEQKKGMILDAKKIIDRLEEEIYELSGNCLWCGANCYCDKELVGEHITPSYSQRALKTKLKWVLDENNYRVAVVTKNGILQVKCVVEGRVYCHDSGTCECKACSEINLSDKLGVPHPPWSRLPFIKTFFKDEAEWRNSLPSGGTVSVTVPKISDKMLKKLCNTPLTALSHALQLKELEVRFPGAVMLLTTNRAQFDIQYIFYPNADCDDYWKHQIYNKTSKNSFISFYDIAPGQKIQLMAIWNNMYIDLSHLF